MVATGSLQLHQQLGEKYGRFVQAVAQGMPNEAAAAHAGFAPSTGSQLARRPEIVAALHQEVSRILAWEGAPIGLSTLIKIAKDESAPKGVRVDAAKTLLARAGHIEPRGTPEKADTKELTAMSQDELRAVINDCEGELGARAQPIGAPLSSEPVDIFE